jgi:Tfp pilus assembly protein PilF
MLYAMLLHSTNHKTKALEHYRKALEAEPAHAQAQYNMGLLLVDMKKYDEANEIANNLYSRGYPLPGLKNKLIKAKVWQGSSE